MFLHGLTDLVPRTLYVNKEQSPKPAPDPGSLTQATLNRAFAAKTHRTSKYSYSYDDYAIVSLSGKNTKNLEVIPVAPPAGPPVPCTSIERTLIDIVVRPAYAGGIREILEVYRAAKEQFSVRKLARVLRQLNYLYPYHQAIGFLLQRSGYSENQLANFRRFSTELDFYLTYGLKPEAADYSEEWRLYYPSGL